MSIDEVKQIIGQPESDRLEYKTTLPPANLTARIIAAFANTEGGWLVIGVKETPTGIEIVGVSSDVPAPTVVESSLARLRPKPDVAHDFVLIGKKQVYVVEIKKSDKTIIAEDENVFLRRGAYIKLASPNEIVSVLKASNEPRCIKQVLEKLNAYGNNATEAEVGFLRQYTSLAQIVATSVEIISPDTPSTPSKFPQGRTLSRLIFSSLADTFERYLADLLIEIHYAQPSTLKSESPFTSEEILNCSNMTEVIRLIANKKVGDLPKGNSKEFGKYIKRIAKIDLFLPNEQPKADLIFEIRNVFTHSNGMVDEKFLRNTQTKSLKVGDERMLTLEELCETFHFFLDVSHRIDEQSIQKYKLSTSKV